MFIIKGFIVDLQLLCLDVQNAWKMKFNKKTFSPNHECKIFWCATAYNHQTRNTDVVI